MYVLVCTYKIQISDLFNKLEEKMYNKCKMQYTYYICNTSYILKYSLVNPKSTMIADVITLTLEMDSRRHGLVLPMTPLSIQPSTMDKRVYRNS